MTQQRVVKRNTHERKVPRQRGDKRKAEKKEQSDERLKKSNPSQFKEEKKHIGEKLWTSGMLARCFNRTCMDMLSVGVCDTMSVHTLTVLAGKKEFLSSINLEDLLVPHDAPNLFPQHFALCGAVTSIRDAEVCAHDIFHIWKEKRLC